MAALNDGTPALGRTSIGTMEDERNVFNEGNSAPFRMSTLAPDVYPAAPANIQFTRTSITGVADGDDDSDDLKDPEKGEVRLPYDPGCQSVSFLGQPACHGLCTFYSLYAFSMMVCARAVLFRAAACMHACLQYQAHMCAIFVALIKSLLSSLCRQEHRPATHNTSCG